MANEPERKIEELLRAYAQKRREQAGNCFELHPATRRLLQAEVARVFPQRNGAGSWMSFLGLIWVRAGLAVSILLVLGVTVYLMHPWEKQSSQYAAATTKSPAPPTVNAPAPVAPAPIDALTTQSAPMDKALADSEVRMKGAREMTPASKAPAPPAAPPAIAKEEQAKDLPLTLSAPAPAANSELNDQAGDLNAKNAKNANSQFRHFSPQQAEIPDNSANSPNLLAAKPAKPANSDAAQPSLGFAAPAAAPQEQSQTKFDQTPTVTQRFAKAPSVETLARPMLMGGAAGGSRGGAGRGRAAANAPVEVLNSFTLEQTGDRIRIIDSDGSVYEGQLVAAAEESKSMEAPARLQQQLPLDHVQEAAPQTTTNALTFRATGTNVTLKQLVVVQATILPNLQQDIVSSEAKANVAPAAPLPAAEALIPRASRAAGGSFTAAAPMAKSARQADLLSTQPVQFGFQGTARVGNYPEVSIKAVRVSP